MCSMQYWLLGPEPALRRGCPERRLACARLKGCPVSGGGYPEHRWVVLAFDRVVRIGGSDKDHRGADSTGRIVRSSA